MVIFDLLGSLKIVKELMNNPNWILTANQTLDSAFALKYIGTYEYAYQVFVSSTFRFSWCSSQMYEFI